MRKLFFWSIILAFTLIHAQDKELKVKGNIKITFENGSNTGGVLSGKANEIINSWVILISNNGLTSGVSKELMLGLTPYPSKLLKENFANNWKAVPKEEADKIINGDLKEKLFESFLKFNLLPINAAAGSSTLRLYCKYLFGKLKGKPEGKNFTYDMTYDEFYFDVPVGKETVVDIWKDILPAGAVVKCKMDLEEQDKKETAANPASDLNDMKVETSAEELVKFSKQSGFGKAELKIGIELLRTSADRKTVIERKASYPLLAIDSQLYGATVFQGKVKLPKTIYNPNKKAQYDKYVSGNPLAWYGIMMVPVKKKNNVYTFEARIFNGDKGGNAFLSKQFDIVTGGKYVFEFGSDKTIFNILADGKPVEINMEQDYSKYVKDFLVISLESEK